MTPDQCAAVLGVLGQVHIAVEMAEGPLKAKEQIKVRSYVNRQQTVIKHSNMQGTPSELLPCFSSFSFYFHPFFSFPLLLSGPSLPLTFLLLILSPSCLLCPIHSFLSYLFLSTLFFPLSLYSSQHLDMEENSKSLKEGENVYALPACCQGLLHFSEALR